MKAPDYTQTIWSWLTTDTSAPVAISTEDLLRGTKPGTRAVYRVTKVVVTVFEDGESHVDATGRKLTKAGTPDGRHMYSRGVTMTSGTCEEFVAAARAGMVTR